MKRSDRMWPWDPYGPDSRKLREDVQRLTSAITSTPSRTRTRAVVFASPNSGAGASTVTLGVGRELQRVFQARPLVVEMNRVTPSLAKRYELSNKRSVVALHAGELSLAECAQKDPSGLLMVPAGGEWAGASAARIVCEILQQAESEFDTLLFDSPPVLSAADTLAIAGVVKELILVVPAGRTRTEELTRIKRQAEQNGVKIVGAVLTMQDRVAPGWLRR